MSQNPHIVVVGSTNTDLVISVPHIPAPGETILGGDLRTVPGGKGANQAVAAARAGARVTFIARTGSDTYGEATRTHLLQEGINTTYLLTTENTPSGVAFITISRTNGENAIVVAPGANSHLTPADIDNALPAFQTAHAVVLSLEVPLETIKHAAKLAFENNIPVILNPAPAQPLPDTLLAHTTILTPNETEMNQLLPHTDTNTPAAEIARQLQEKGVQSIVLTQGANGVTLYENNTAQHFPALPVTALDTVAAGDCFTGVLAVSLATGQTKAAAIRTANAAAALSVTRPGAQDSLPTATEINHFLENKPA